MQVLGERGEPIPPPMALAIVCNVLHGLHAAHEAVDATGSGLRIVHRDASPHNVLVGTDGVARILDFGIAKATSRLQSTLTGEMKGKVAYMSPEQVQGGLVDRRSDIFTMGIVLWELLTSTRLFYGGSEPATVHAVLEKKVVPPVEGGFAATALNAIVLRALERDVSLRFQTCEEIALALEDAVALPKQREVAAWLGQVAEAQILERHTMVRRIEALAVDDPKPSSPAVSRLLDKVAERAAHATKAADSSGKQPPKRPTLRAEALDLDTARTSGPPQDRVDSPGSLRPAAQSRPSANHSSPPSAPTPPSAPRSSRPSANHSSPPVAPSRPSATLSSPPSAPHSSRPSATHATPPSTTHSSRPSANHSSPAPASVAPKNPDPAAVTTPLPAESGAPRRPSIRKMQASFDSAVTQVRTNPHGEIDEIRRLYAAGEITSAMARAESVWCPEKLSHGTVLKVTVTPATLLHLPLDPKGAFVFSRVDGVSDVEAILHVAGMPEDEAIALLEKLVIVGAISVASSGQNDDDNTMETSTDVRPEDDTLTLRR